MDIKRKERIVGLMALLALAIIFLPSLFYREQPRVAVDTVSLIPAKPNVDPVVVRRPVPTEFTSAPSPQQAFQPNKVASAQEALRAKESVPKVVTSKAKNEKTNASVSNTKKVAPKPSLNAKGIPNAWVVQLGSFKSEKLATDLKKKLLKSDYKAYAKPINTKAGRFFRVFVGPYIDKSRALSAQKSLDKAHKVKSRILVFSPE